MKPYRHHPMAGEMDKWLHRTGALGAKVRMRNTIGRDGRLHKSAPGMFLHEISRAAKGRPPEVVKVYKSLEQHCLYRTRLSPWDAATAASGVVIPLAIWLFGQEMLDILNLPLDAVRLLAECGNEKAAGVRPILEALNEHA